MSADINLISPGTTNQPVFRLSLVDKTKGGKNYIYWSKKDIVLMTKGNNLPQQWNSVSTNDMFTLDDYRNYSNMDFELALYNNTTPNNLKINKLKVNIYGKNKLIFIMVSSSL